MLERFISRKDLTVLEQLDGMQIYDAADPLVQQWLRFYWQSGYNPLALAEAGISTGIRLVLPENQYYDYQEPGHSYEHYRKNMLTKWPNYFVHITYGGWIEYSIRENNRYIGKESGTWTASFHPQKWYSGSFPGGYEFTQPPRRIIELIFDANILRKEGYIAKPVPEYDTYLFDGKIPLSALVPTSKAYLSQVLNLESDPAI